MVSFEHTAAGLRRSVFVLATGLAALLACSGTSNVPVAGDTGSGASGGSRTSNPGGGNGSSSSGTGSATSSSSSSGSSSSSSSSGSASSSSSGGSSTSIVGGFTFSGWIDDAVSGDPLEGVQVCLFASPGVCTTTDVNGTINLTGLAASGDGITATFSGYPTGIWPITPTGNISGWTINLRTDARIATLATQVGATFGSTTGAIVFDAYDGSGNNLSGVSVSTPAGTVGYFTGTGAGLDSTLTATTSVGGGYIFGVPPGNVEVTFTSPGLVCARNGAEGWPGSGSATTTVPVVAGELTRAAGACQ